MIQSYVEASLSRNPLSRAAVTYLVNPPTPFSEDHELHNRLASLRARVHTHPFPHIHDATIHCDTRQAHPLPDVPWVVTDGALTARAPGGGIVLCHPRLGVLRTYHFGFLVVQATSTDTEWIPKLVARYILRAWTGHAFFLADATASLHCAFTRAPPPP